MKHLLSLHDWTPEDIEKTLTLAAKLKKEFKTKQKADTIVRTRSISSALIAYKDGKNIYTIYFS